MLLCDPDASTFMQLAKPDPLTSAYDPLTYAYKNKMRGNLKVRSLNSAISKNEASDFWEFRAAAICRFRSR